MAQQEGGLAQFFLQTTNPSLARRLAHYGNARDGLTLCPPGFCEVAEVVEAANTSSGRDGPSLARFWGSRLTAAQLNAWVIGGPVDSSVLRVYWMGGSPSAAASREQLVQQLRAAAAPPGPLRLQCYPRTMEAPLADELDGTEGFDLQPVNPAWVLHIVQLPPQREEQQPGGEAAQGSPAQQQQTQQQRQQRYLWSLQPAADQYLYAAAREKRIPNQLSKAAGKLAEALAVAGVRFTSGTAVDLGAAPGGWTQVLARHAQRVIAVDPAAMDPRVAQLPSVTHLACKAEDAVERIHELAGASGIDLLVSDINKHPAQLTAMIAPLVPLLHPGGALIFTLKFHGRSSERGGEWQQQLAPGLAALGLERVQLVWLLANTQHEMTCVAWKAGFGNGSSAAAASGSAQSAAAVGDGS